MRQARWQALWLIQSQHRGWLALLLWPVSRLYGALVRLRGWLFAQNMLQTHQIDVPVIVVGNVVVGGAGKTPTVIALVNHLTARGWRPGVVSRGHGRHSQGVVDLTPDTPTGDSGDEPALIRFRTGVPVCVGASRVNAAQVLLASHPEVNIVVCDDGLQHHALHRDLQIVVFDDRGAGNGWLLPAGLLREPWPRAASSGTPGELVLQQHREGTPVAGLVCAPDTAVFRAQRRLADHAVGPAGEHIPLRDLPVHGVTAVAGVARPSVFFDMLRAKGLTPGREVGLPDHANAADYLDLIQDSAATLICTEKDAVKVFPLLTHVPAQRRAKVWAVPLDMTPDPAFFSAVDHHLSALKPNR